VTLFWLAVLWLTASTFMFVFLPAGARRQSGSLAIDREIVIFE
jgi:hypothetical protein